MRPVISQGTSDTVGDLGIYRSYLSGVESTHVQRCHCNPGLQFPAQNTLFPSAHTDSIPPLSLSFNSTNPRAPLPTAVWSDNSSKSHSPCIPNHIAWYLITQWDVLLLFHIYFGQFYNVILYFREISMCK